MFAAIAAHDWWAFAATSIVAASILACGLLASRLKMGNRTVSRKLMHIGTGPVYLSMWPMYSDAPEARWLCGLVPLLAAAYFAVVGFGMVPHGLLVQSATRKGRKEELLFGPILYGVVHFAIAVCLWRASPAACVAIATLGFGDGAAELIGKNFGRRRLWHNPQKTLEGSLACFLAAALGCYAMLRRFTAQGLYLQPYTDSQLIAGSVAPALAAALVESLPLPEVDNLTVPLTAIAVASLIFR